MTISTTSLHTGTHRLTDLPGEKHPQKCQLCGHFDPLEGIKVGRSALARWQEHDHHDRPEHRLIVLCEICSKRVIKPHPRLYERLMPAAPWPGCMAICVDCKLRDGTRCTSPDAKWNGGAGVMLTIEKPLTGMIDGTKYSGPMVLWTSPASACKQKQS
jgi:hypothetical protein